MRERIELLGGAHMVLQVKHNLSKGQYNECKQVRGVHVCNNLKLLTKARYTGILH